MKIQKITNKYNLYQEGVDYILDLGNIKRAEERTTELIISELENSNLLSVIAKCGCTATEKTTIDESSISVKVDYKDCDPTFTKIVELRYNNIKTALIKIIGKCNN